MNRTLVKTAAGIIFSLTVVAMSASVEAGKGGGSRGGGQSGGFGNSGGSGNSSMSNSGAMYGGSRASDYGQQKGSGSSKSQHKHQNQHQYRYRKGKGGGQGQVERTQYSDFQGWLDQSQTTTQTKTQNRVNTQTMR